MIDIEKGAHRLKPDGLHTGPEAWNQQWDDFFKQYPSGTDPTQKEILDHLGKMRKDFGLE